MVCSPRGPRPVEFTLYVNFVFLAQCLQAAIIKAIILWYSTACTSSHIVASLIASTLVYDMNDPERQTDRQINGRTPASVGGTWVNLHLIQTHNTLKWFQLPTEKEPEEESEKRTLTKTFSWHRISYLLTYLSRWYTMDIKHNQHLVLELTCNRNINRVVKNVNKIIKDLCHWHIIQELFINTFFLFSCITYKISDQYERKFQTTV